MVFHANDPHFLNSFSFLLVSKYKVEILCRNCNQLLNNFRENKLAKLKNF